MTKTGPTRPRHALLISLWMLASAVLLHGQVPTAPSLLRAWPVSDTAIALSWQDNASTETSYEIQRRPGDGGTWQTITSGLPVNTVQYEDTGLPPDTAYQYRVLARNGSGTSASGAARAITDDRPFGNRSLSFQNGIGQYASALSIGIMQTQPATRSTAGHVWIDNNGPTDDNQALIDFPAIFGPEPDRVPPGAKVARAYLRIFLGPVSNGHSYKTVSFHRMLVPWTPSSAWNSATWGGNGVQANDVEAVAKPDAIRVFGMANLYYDVDVTPTVRAWAAGEAQHGWVVRTGWSDGFAFYTTNNTTVASRPELVVQFDSDPANHPPEILSLAGPPNAQGSVPEPARPGAAVFDADGDALRVRVLGRAAPVADQPEFTVALLPDTQFYSAEMHGATRHIFFRQTDWIVENREAENIAFVLHMGDMTQTGDIKSGAPNSLEWSIVAQAMYRLHNPQTTGLAEGIPYGVNVGNHDQEPMWRSSGTTTFFNQYFGVDHFSQYSYYGGHYGANNDNHYYRFEVGAYRFLVISLEYHDPARDPLDHQLLEWADNLLKTHPDHRGIVVSHHMVNPGYPATWSPYGQAMYEVLKDNPNLHLMLGGHVTGEGLRIEEFEGNTVYALVQDYQGYPNGGNGYLRLMTFVPRANEIRLRTYSPWIDAELDEFGGRLTLPYPLGTVIPEFQELAPPVETDSGAQLNLPWFNLEGDTTYEWQVEVSDGRKSTRSEIQLFHTAPVTYTTWRRNHFAADDPQGEPTADPDGDGIDNFREFLFGGDPNSAADRNLPQLVAATTATPPALVLKYSRPANTGIVYQYESSTDLRAWEPVPEVAVTESVTAIDGLSAIDQVSLPLPLPHQDHSFWRVHPALDW
jgi:hypothetical protein